jgi:hypothetical protein
MKLIPAELVTELATSAKLTPLVHPGDAPPEPGYVPSKALAEFVRCRDLTCRWPGCDKPAWQCDLDHTIPYACVRRSPCRTPGRHASRSRSKVTRFDENR